MKNLKQGQFNDPSNVIYFALNRKELPRLWGQRRRELLMAFVDCSVCVTGENQNRSVTIPLFRRAAWAHFGSCLFG